MNKGTSTYCMQIGIFRKKRQIKKPLIKAPSNGTIKGSLNTKQTNKANINIHPIVCLCT